MDSEPLNVATLIETVRERAASEDPLVLLETAVAVSALVGDAADAMVDHFVGMARGVGQSWTAIGDRLGVSKQAARQRFSRRLGEPTHPGEAAAQGVAPRLTACLQAAQEAADADDSVPGTQHLLFVLATDPGSSARRVLNDLSVDVAVIKKELEGPLGRTQRRGRRRRHDTPARKCTFCGCTEPSRPMVAGHGVWICTDCVTLATDILNTQDRGLHAT